MPVFSRSSSRADFLPETWVADDQTQRPRRLVAWRVHRVKQRTQLKNQVHAILSRNLVPTCPHADLFSGVVRRWLAIHQSARGVPAAPLRLASTGSPGLSVESSSLLRWVQAVGEVADVADHVETVARPKPVTVAPVKVI